jgi:AraC-like DNA-binding protein
VNVRTIRRNLKGATGLSPKQFSMIVQFHRALRLIKEHGLDASAAAIEAGYADQAHMTRVFRRLGGFTPAAIPEVTLANIFDETSDLFKTSIRD